MTGVRAAATITCEITWRRRRIAEGILVSCIVNIPRCSWLGGSCCPVLSRPEPNHQPQPSPSAKIQSPAPIHIQSPASTQSLCTNPIPSPSYQTRAPENAGKTQEWSSSGVIDVVVVPYWLQKPLCVYWLSRSLSLPPAIILTFTSQLGPKEGRGKNILKLLTLSIEKETPTARNKLIDNTFSIKQSPLRERSAVFHKNLIPIGVFRSLFSWLSIFITRRLGIYSA